MLGLPNILGAGVYVMLREVVRMFCKLNDALHYLITHNYVYITQFQCKITMGLVNIAYTFGLYK